MRELLLDDLQLLRIVVLLQVEEGILRVQSKGIDPGEVGPIGVQNAPEQLRKLLFGDGLVEAVVQGDLEGGGVVIADGQLPAGGEVQQRFVVHDLIGHVLRIDAGDHQMGTDLFRRVLSLHGRSLQPLRKDLVQSELLQIEGHAVGGGTVGGAVEGEHQRGGGVCRGRLA